MPNFIDIYKSKRKGEKRKFISLISDECGMSESTLMYKVGGRSTFTKLEKEKISSILNISVEELFPEHETAKI